MLTRTILSATILLLTATWAARGKAGCDACVEDVVVETRDGQWLSGYIYWNKPPFHYLDLGRAADRLELERGTGSTQKLRLWAHAVSISRDRFPSGLGEPPPAPAPPSEFARPPIEEGPALLTLHFDWGT